MATRELGIDRRMIRDYTETWCRQIITQALERSGRHLGCQHGADPTGQHQATGDDRLVGQKGMIDRAQTQAHDQHHRKIEGTREIGEAIGGGQRHQKPSSALDHDPVHLAPCPLHETHDRRQIHGAAPAILNVAMTVKAGQKVRPAV